MATPALLSDSSPERAQRSSLGPTAVAPPLAKGSPLWIHALLAVLTLLSTTAIGMRYMDNFHQGRFPLASENDVVPYPWIWAHRTHLAQGLPFSLTLLGILIVHEFGHYFACRAYKVKATLPFLLPAPSLSGTAGAVIRLRSRVKSRNALLAIGAMGPLCGYVVAVVGCVLGLACSRSVLTEPQHLVVLARPLLFSILLRLFGPALHLLPGAPLLWHPVLVASWIGILITSLNLIPAGQLDGGHILYALSPRVHRITTVVTMSVLVVLGIFCWLGWLLWCALLLLPGMRHPNMHAADPLKTTHKLLAVSGLLLFILSVSTTPFSDSSLIAFIHRFHW